MKINRLDWDSAFFGIDVFSIIACNEAEVKAFLLDNSNKRYLIYAFMGTNKLSDDFIKMNNGLLTDTKITFKKSINGINHKTNDSITEYKDKQPIKALYTLAFQSGKYSRFKLDNRLQKNKFEELYSLWIEKSCSDDAIKVYTYKTKSKINGFITVTIKNNIGEIGLIAVNNDTQGRGIGYKLLNHVENYLTSNNINTITVPTQKDNRPAMNFYKKNGFIEFESQNIYHFIK